MNKWTHLSPNGMATNPDPYYGGVIDYAIVSGLWFVIPNNDEIRSIEDLPSKEAAFDYLKNELKRLADETSEYK